MSAAAAKELVQIFQAGGYMRRRSAELAEEMGPYGYKKGDETRIRAEFLKWLPDEPLESPAGEGRN